MKQPTLADLKRISEPDTTATTVTSMANLRRAVAIAEREAAMVDRLVRALIVYHGDAMDRDNASDMGPHNSECSTCKLLAEVAEMRKEK